MIGFFSFSGKTHPNPWTKNFWDIYIAAVVQFSVLALNDIHVHNPLHPISTSPFHLTPHPITPQSLCTNPSHPLPPPLLSTPNPTTHVNARIPFITGLIFAFRLTLPLGEGDRGEGVWVGLWMGF